MANAQLNNKQPSQQELQNMLDAYNAAQLPQAEAAALLLLNKYPNAPILRNVLANTLAGQAKFVAAIPHFEWLVSQNPRQLELLFNLANICLNACEFDKAIQHYRKVITLNPKIADVHYNLGTAYQAQNNWFEAESAYKKALQIQPNFFEAHGNLGAVLQAQGKLNEAIVSYQKVLIINPSDARGHFNLATALRNSGLLDDAIKHYRQAIVLFPNYIEAYTNLGEALFDLGDSEAAVAHYQKALSLSPDDPQANYKLGIFLYDSAKLREAIVYFERSQLDDWRERVLYCLYKTMQYEAFRKALAAAMTANRKSPFLATLSAHHAANFAVKDDYNFCKNPIDFIYHGHIADISSGKPLLLDLLNDINHAEIAKRKQSRLSYGEQSSGNLFKRSEKSFNALADLIKQHILQYKRQFATQHCELILSFPDELDISSSWYVKMQSGGNLTSHIHETGWLSGSVYLSVPAGQNLDGAIEFSTHGDNYPKLHDNFPVKAILPIVGDIVLFPSSLFHRTLPFNSTQPRICIAFDLKPA